MKVIGLTGGVGSGKSTVAAIMEKNFSCGIIIADEAGRECMKKGQDCYYKITELFGTGVLAGNGEIDRNRLSSLVFRSKDRLERLNAIVHPSVHAVVAEKIRNAREEDKYKYLVIESAILFEAGYETICDEVWFVSAAESVRRERLRSDRGYTDDKINAIMENQMSEAEYRNKCRRIIENNETAQAILDQLEFLLV